MMSLSFTAPPDNVTTTDSSTKQATSFWKSKMFWIIAGVALAVAVIVLVVVIALIVSDTSAKEEPQWSVQLKKNMDFSIDPCVDFYQYACGGWHATESVQKSNQEISFLSIMREHAKKKMMDTLTDPGFMEVNDFLRVPKEYFAACKALGQNESFNDFFKLVNDVGVFPLLENIHRRLRYSPYKKIIAEAMPKLTKMGAASVFTTDVLENSEFNRLAIFPPNRAIWNEYKEEYKNWIRDVLELLRIERYSMDMDALFSHEDAIARSGIPDDHKTKTVEELSSVFKWMDINDFLYEISRDPITKKGKFSKNDLVYVHSYQYLQLLPLKIIFHPDSYEDVFINYAMKDLLKFTSALDARFPAFPGTPADNTDNRSEKCFLETIKEFAEVFSRIFAVENLNGISLYSIHELVSSVKIGFKTNLEEKIWLDYPWARDSILNVLETLNFTVGYPEFVLNDTHLYKMYSQVRTSRYFWAVVTLREAQFSNKMKRLKNSKLDTWMWKDHFLNMNDDFRNDRNIVLPSVILRSPVYNHEWPSSMLYGTLGFITGHQIAHIIKEKTYGPPKEMIDCFEDQYNSYTFQDFTVNGTQSRFENAQDTHGLKASFKAYRDYISKHGEGPSLPWLNFTHDQLFFINYAQMHCQKIPSSMTSEAVQRSDLPQEIRVKGTLKNSKEFSEAFGCKMGSPMNPEKKCYK